MSSTMTLDEIRDELAKLAGWHRRTAHGDWVKPERRPWTDMSSDPIPLSLEEAAKLPEGWTWTRELVEFPRNGAKTTLAMYHLCWVATIKNANPQTVPDTGNEMYDRFALRLACERAERESR